MIYFKENGKIYYLYIYHMKLIIYENLIYK